MDVCAACIKTRNHKTFCNDHQPKIFPSARTFQLTTSTSWEKRGKPFLAFSISTSFTFFGSVRHILPCINLLNHSVSAKHETMDKLLPMRRGDGGDIHLAGIGAVSLRIVYDSVLGKGDQGVVFVGEILGKTDSRLIMKVSGILRCGRR